MPQTRVFHLANEYGVDTNSVIEVLQGIGCRATRPEEALNAPAARKARDALARQFPKRAAALRQASGEHEQAPVARERQKQKAPMSWSELQRETVKKAIPRIWAELTSVSGTSSLRQVVVCHDVHRSRQAYEVIALDGGRIGALTGPEYRRIVAPLKAAHEWFRSKRKEPPNVHIAFDLEKGTAWFGKKLATVQSAAGCPRYDAETLESVSTPSVPASGEPPKVVEKAHRVQVSYVPELVEGLSDGKDRPEAWRSGSGVCTCRQHSISVRGTCRKRRDRRAFSVERRQHRDLVHCKVDQYRDRVRSSGRGRCSAAFGRGGSNLPARSNHSR